MAEAVNGSLFGQAERDFGKMTGAGKSELGKEDFLKLLVTQLSHQDPLNPTDDKEFVAQLSQFSSLEQLTNISGGIDTMNTGFTRQNMTAAVGFIGKAILSKGETVTRTANDTSVMYFELDAPATSGIINIYDPNNNLIRSEALGPKQPGGYEYKWDGLDYAGQPAPEGVYQISMYAEGVDGKPILIETQITGNVVGVQNEDGQQYLRLSDGRLVKFFDVKEVVQPTQTQPQNNGGQSGGDSGDGNSSGDGTGDGSGGDSSGGTSDGTSGNA